MNAKRILFRTLPPVAVLVLLAAALEFYVHARHVPRYLLSPPSQIIKTLTNEQTRKPLLIAFWNTTQAAGMGFLASAIVGLLLAVPMSASRWLRSAFLPYTIFFQTVPLVAIAPLLVIWMEPGIKAVAVSAFVVSVFPVITNTLTGFLSTDPALVDLFTLYRASALARFWKLRLPYALPQIFSGLRVSAGLSVIGAVVAEVLVGTIGNNEGLGVRIANANKNGQTDRLFAAVLLTSLLGLALFALVNAVSFAILRRWHASARDEN